MLPVRKASACSCNKVLPEDWIALTSIMLIHLMKRSILPLGEVMAPMVHMSVVGFGKSKTLPVGDVDAFLVASH